MSDTVATVEQAAAELNLHPKTVLRYIHDGRLPATRIGKSYRIGRAALRSFAGVQGDAAGTTSGVRVTCIVDLPDITPDEAQRVTDFLQSAALAADSRVPPLHLETAHDPVARSLKLVVIGGPAEAGRLLEMLDVQLRGRA